MEEHVKTIIFFGDNPEALYKSLALLCNCIKERTDTDHKLFVSPMSSHIYVIMKREPIDEINTRLGSHELIFMPNDDKIVQRLIQTKSVLYYRNCMSFVGDSEKKQQKVQEIIDWMLEMKEDIKL